MFEEGLKCMYVGRSVGRSVWCGAGVPATTMFVDGSSMGGLDLALIFCPPVLSGIRILTVIQTRSHWHALMSTNMDSDLSPEVLSRLLILCNHPQVQGYRRGPRGRRGAIYISADENLSTTAISSFSASSVLEIDPIRRNSFSG